MVFVVFYFFSPPFFSLLLFRSWHRVLGMNVWQHGCNNLFSLPVNSYCCLKYTLKKNFETNFCTTYNFVLDITEQMVLINWSMQVGKVTVWAPLSAIHVLVLSHSSRLIMSVKWGMLNKICVVKILVSSLCFWIAFRRIILMILTLLYLHLLKLKCKYILHAKLQQCSCVFHVETAVC